MVNFYAVLDTRKIFIRFIMTITSRDCDNGQGIGSKRYVDSYKTRIGA
jgi:hypothetical protein